MSIEVRNITQDLRHVRRPGRREPDGPAGGTGGAAGPRARARRRCCGSSPGLEEADRQRRDPLPRQDVASTPVGDRQVGFVFQHYALFRHMTVFENVAFGLRVRPR